ncbi:MAG: hypothetical protein KDD53_05685 [Bdellovibrionales bacterium]|nr:hypothetical protein [Bdellovibrionales bacterium]
MTKELRDFAIEAAKKAISEYSTSLTRSMAGVLTGSVLSQIWERYPEFLDRIRTEFGASLDDGNRDLAKTLEEYLVSGHTLGRLSSTVVNGETVESPLIALVAHVKKTGLAEKLLFPEV